MPFHRGGFVGAVLLLAVSSCFDFDSFDVSKSNPAPIENPNAQTPPSSSGRAALGELRVPRGSTRRFEIHIEGGTTIPSAVTNLPPKVTAKIESSGSKIELVLSAALDASPGTTKIKVEQLPGDHDLTITSAALDPAFGDGGVAIGDEGEFEDLALDDEGHTELLLSTRSPGGFELKREPGNGQFEDFFDARATSPVHFGLGAKGVKAVAFGSTGLQLWIRGLAGTWQSTSDVLAPNAHVARVAIIGEGANTRALVLTSGRNTRKFSGGADDFFGLVLHQVDALQRKPDPTFGELGGRAYYEWPATNEARDFLISKYGYVACGTNAENGMVLVRFLAGSGALDPSFGTNGAIRHVAPSGATKLSCRSLTTENVAGEEKLLVAGEMTVGDNTLKPFVTRLEASGAIDHSFGQDGFLILPKLENGIAHGIDQHFVVGGVTDSRAFVVRLNDPLFGPDEGASFTLTPPSGEARVVKVDASGRVLIGGTTTLPGKKGWFVARILLP